MSLFLRYASHLGYVSPDEPLFKASVNSTDPWAHVEFAAAQGLAGVLYPWALSRPEEEVARFGEALRHFQMQAGCIVYAPKASIQEPVWMQTGATARARLSGFFEQSISMAQRLGSNILAVLVTADPEQNQESQMTALIENMKFVGDQVAQAGMEIGIEPMIALPNMYLQNFAQVTELFERVEHPAIKFIFDPGHITQMGEDVPMIYTTMKKYINLFQLVDMPGRVELGAGTIDFVTLLSEAYNDGLAGGLIELEHGWSAPGAAVEQRAIETLKQIDSAVAQAVSK